MKIFFLFSMLILFGCNIVPIQGELKSNLQTPIIFLTGYNNKADLWEKEGFVKYLQVDKSLIYGGRLFFDSSSKDNILSTKNDTLSKMDYFCVSFSDSTASINILSLELKKMIDYVIGKTNTTKVTLVGYSMGGLVARQYLTENLENHKVNALITIASPHKGSFWANGVYGANLLLGGTNSAIITKITKWLDEPISSVSISQMIQSGDESFLTTLNQKEHPNDISYHSIIAKKSLASNFKSILDFFEIKIPKGNNDYVITDESQNMNNIRYFRENNLTFEVTIIEDAHHFQVLKRYDEIYKVLKKYLIFEQ